MGCDPLAVGGKDEVTNSIREEGTNSDRDFSGVFVADVVVDLGSISIFLLLLGVKILLSVERVFDFVGVVVVVVVVVNDGADNEDEEEEEECLDNDLDFDGVVCDFCDDDLVTFSSSNIIGISLLELVPSFFS